MKKSLVIFLTHNFRPIFSKTLIEFDLTIDDRIGSVVLFDAKSSYPCDIELKNIKIEKVETNLRLYDSVTRAHNFTIEYLNKNPNLMEEFDYFWVVENDVYYHGSFRSFIDIHDKYEYDLLVPEFGLRPLNWGWPGAMKGISNSSQIGVTAVIHRLSKKLINILVPGIINGTFSGHLESLLPHLCIERNMNIQQFIPNYYCSVNTFRSKFIGLIESDIINKTNIYIENKLYHPVKL
jgi:hypothetical protein